MLPFENLTSDAKLNFIGSGAAAALVSDLSGLRQLYPFRADSIRTAYAARASEVLQSTFESSGGRLRLHAVVENLSSHKVARQLSVDGPLREGILPLVNRLAKNLDAGALPFSTRDTAAFESFAEGLSSPDQAAQARWLETASLQDPQFSASYIDWSETLLAVGDRASAAKAAASGMQHANSPIDRARLKYLSAVAQGDSQARERTLLALAQATPADPDLSRALAQLHLLERKFPAAVKDFQAATRADPNDPATYNAMAYAQAFALDLAGSKESLGHYQKLAPDGDLNPLDSFGEVNFFLGQFGEAERYFHQASQPASNSLKAAQARLMTGDRNGADAIFSGYLASRKAEDPVLRGYQRARWDWLAGRRKQAVSSLLGALPSASGDTAALLAVQLSIWNLQTGSREEAARLANAAATQARTPGAQTLAALCRYISAETVQLSGNNLADGYAALLAGRFAEAIPPLASLYKETAPAADGQIRTLLAWACVKAGRVVDAAALVNTYPIPLAGDDAVFASFAFPRFLQVRAVVLESQGKRDEAQRLMGLYRQYSGDLPDKY